MSRIVAVAMLAGAAGLSPVRGEDPQSDARLYERWVDYYKLTASEYDIRLDGDMDRELTLRPEPVHTYHHPDGAGLKEHLGSLFVWTRDGRPEVLGGIWSYPFGEQPTRRNIVHEFVSLSESPLRAVRRDETFWEPREAGVGLQEIPGAQPAAASRGLRLAQMRTLARQFSAFSRINGRDEALRLAPQPLYRYAVPEDSPDVVDGALFVYFFDWDPEVFLLVEARRDGDAVNWYFASARFSDKELRLAHKGLQVWTSPPVALPAEHTFGARDGEFYAVHGVDQHEIIPE